MNISDLIRSTEEYIYMCESCKDDVQYPNISGRTNYTQNEVEFLTLQNILEKYSKLKEWNEVNKPTGICEICTDTSVLENTLLRRLLKDILELFNLSQYDILEDQNEIITELKHIASSSKNNL